jgi:stress-induced-phosphoprotein 1
MCQKDPQMMMQLVQTDPRMMDVFKEITGIDLMDMQAQQMKSKEKAEEMRKKRDEEEAKRKAEEDKKRKEEEENALPQEEKDRIARKKAAEVKKNEGNEYYKKKQFEEALKLYDEAISLDENEVTYLNNKAAVYFEQKNYEKCLETCDQAINLSKGGNYDYVKLGKALARKGTTMLALNRFDEAIELYRSSLLESNDGNVKDQLRKAEKAKKEDEERKMIDPTLAEEYREKGNELFKEGNYPGAIKEYTEGLKRDPNSKAIYANRSQAYIKLAEFPSALKDAEKCL